MLRALAATAAAVLLAAAPARAATDPLRPHQWALDMIGADSSHQTSEGAGATVGVVDTGAMVNHPDLAGRLLGGIDLLASGPNTRDGNGHGTHVSGIIAADEGNGIGIEGVAPLAKVLPIRALGDDGSGNDQDVATGVNWAVDHGADVINLSLGGLPIDNFGASAFQASLVNAIDHGVVVVLAAGNDTLPLCEQPGTAGRALCVGAVDRRGTQAYYSSFGAGVNVMAPGGSALPGTDEDILSTYNDGSYKYLAGTSQAAPQVSGVAALLVALGVRGQAAVQRILATETPSHILDAAAAVRGLHAPSAGGTGPAATGPAATGSTSGPAGGAPKSSRRCRSSRRCCRRPGHRRCSAGSRKHPKASKVKKKLKKGSRRR